MHASMLRCIRSRRFEVILSNFCHSELHSELQSTPRMTDFEFHSKFPVQYSNFHQNSNISLQRVFVVRTTEHL